MGLTYRATRLDDDRTVAVKEIAFRHVRELKEWELARREAEVLEQLDHPQIPRYRDDFLFGRGKNVALFIVQDFIRGRTLANELEARRYTEDDVLAILERILPVLQYLHRRSPPVIHRDVKPGNVMRRDEDGELILIDFGTVRDALKDARMGGSTIVGTHGYMAPEQYEGKAVPATDIYGLGALAVALLSRRDPSSMVRGGARLEWESVVEASEPVRALLCSMLEPDPAERPGQAHWVLDRVREIRAGHRRPDLHAAAPLERAAAPVSWKREVVLGPAAQLSLAGIMVVMTVIVFLNIPGMKFPRTEWVERLGLPTHSDEWHRRCADETGDENLHVLCDDLDCIPACTRHGHFLSVRGAHATAATYYDKACARLNAEACVSLADMLEQGQRLELREVISSLGLAEDMTPRAKADLLLHNACGLGHRGACARVRRGDSPP